MKGAKATKRNEARSAPNTLHKAALEYAKRGWSVHPLKPCDKTPASLNGFKDATRSEKTINKWWHSNLNANIGIATGEKSGFFVIDIDGEQGEEHLAQLEKLHGGLPPTMEAETKRGRHILFRLPLGKVKNSAGKIGPQIDVRGDGGYIVAAPSKHPDGGLYAWKSRHSPDDIGIADAPEWLLELVVAPPRGNSDVRGTGHTLREGYAGGESNIMQSALRSVSDAPKGERNETLNKAAFILGQYIGAGCLKRAEAESALFTAAAQCGLVDDDGESAARETIASGLGAGVLEPRYPRGREKIALSDVGNSKRLVSRHGGDIRHCHAWKCWLIWDGRRWGKDTCGRIVELAKDTATSILEEASEAQWQNLPSAKELTKWGTRSVQRERINAMIDLARSELPISPADLDKDIWAINVNNGTLDLRSGSLRRHRREDFFTKLAPVDYHPDSKCPQFDDVVMTAADEDTDLARYIQRSLGYALTGDVSEECLFFWHGIGRNGKGTIAETVRAVMGEYAATTPAATLTQKDRGGPRNELASLRGVRLVFASEVDEGRKLDEALVKSLTGGDNIAARFLYCEYFEFRPEMKIVLQTNYRPRVHGADEGIWSRIRLVPFNVTIPKKQRDQKLKERLRREELSGVLSWLVRGCLEWQEQGELVEPRAVIDATKSYRDEEDALGGFLDACTVSAEDLAQTPGSVRVTCLNLFGASKIWFEQHGAEPMAQWNFGRKMAARGFQSRSARINGGVQKVYVGLRLRIKSDPAHGEPQFSLVTATPIMDKIGAGTDDVTM